MTAAAPGATAAAPLSCRTGTSPHRRHGGSRRRRGPRPGPRGLPALRRIGACLEQPPSRPDTTRRPPLPEPLRVPVADSHTHLDMQSGTVEEAPREGRVGRRDHGRPGGLRRRGAPAGRPRPRPRTTPCTPPWPCTPTRRRGSCTATRDGWSRQGARRAGGDGGARRGARRDRPPRRAPAGQGRRRDRPRLLPHRARGHGGPGDSFRAHIEIAKRHGKALVIHDRDAHADVLRVLKEEGAPERTVSSTATPATPRWPRSAPRAGYYMSFAGQRHLQERPEPAGRRSPSPRWSCSWSRPTRRS